jgi:hypothetical protein
LEYQGQPHYFSTHVFGNATDQKRKDQTKVTFAKNYGITLIQIPFWWDKSGISLASTIRYHRPDINVQVATSNEAVIPSEIPSKHNRPFKYIPNASTEYPDKIDPTDW